jgi:uncharacterized damage-inducible protein DinB
MQPDQALFALQSALPSLKNESRVTKSVIEAIPVDKGDFRPDAVAKSAFDLAWHIAAAENMFLSGIVGGEFTYNTVRPESIKNSHDIAAWYADQSAKNAQRLTELSGEQLAKVMDFRGLFQFPAVVFLQFALSHGIHHRGQLTMYLRPMGAKVPAIYGESYDSALAKKAAV